jgi:cation transport regulator ChaB
MMLNEKAPQPELKSKLAEKLRERQAARCDEWTIAWLKKRFAEIDDAYLGAAHSFNMAISYFLKDREDADKREQEVAAVVAENAVLREKIGELQAEFVVLQKRFEDMATWAKSVDRSLKQELK